MNEKGQNRHVRRKKKISALGTIQGIKKEEISEHRLSKEKEGGTEIATRRSRREKDSPFVSKTKRVPVRQRINHKKRGKKDYEKKNSVEGCRHEKSDRKKGGGPAAFGLVKERGEGERAECLPTYRG